MCISYKNYHTDISSIHDIYFFLLSPPLPFACTLKTPLSSHGLTPPPALFPLYPPAVVSDGEGVVMGVRGVAEGRPVVVTIIGFHPEARRRLRNGTR